MREEVSLHFEESSRNMFYLALILAKKLMCNLAVTQNFEHF